MTVGQVKTLPTEMDAEEQVNDENRPSNPQICPSIPAMNIAYQNFAAMDQAGIVLAGFRDCSEEAIRYLVDVEKIPEEDGLITGLRHHLWERQQQLDFDKIIEDFGVQDSDEDHRTNLECEMEEQPHSRHCADQPQITIVGCVSPSSEHDQSGDSESSEVMSSECQQTMAEDVEQNSESETENPEEQMTELAFNLALLAQNNPAIANLTQEILTLLENEPAGPTETQTDVEANSST